MSNTTKLMGILNVTPDSFYSESRHQGVQQALDYCIKLVEEGADLIDIGGESTRPGAESVSFSEEINRVRPVIEALHKTLSIPLSIDTMKPEVAEVALDVGASWINDVSGFKDPRMRQLAAERDATICVMHLSGTLQTMQHPRDYPEGITHEILQWFCQRIELLLKCGVKAERIVLDPGIGFKTVADNVEILHNLPKFKALGFPLLIGVSRKSFLSVLTNGQHSERLLAATLTANIIAMQAGVDFVRVHDVKEHKDALTVLNKIKG